MGTPLNGAVINESSKIRPSFQTPVRGLDATSVDQGQRREDDMPTSTELRQNAEARFKKKELQRLDNSAAMAEYEAASRATIEKTARLRALRLSQDVAARPSPAASKGKHPTNMRVRKAASAA
ncbi:MAG: hypothetical protein GEU95_17295 [Rhizobiales bacterium]|nr:hypothetical protein [Hyphomicrobiales bacterium]